MENMTNKTITGKVLGTYLALEKGSSFSTPQNEVTVNFSGFEGDKHASITMHIKGQMERYPPNAMIRNNRQVTVVSVEELAGIAADLDVPEIRPEWMCANLLVEGIPAFTLLPRGTRLYFPEGAVLVVEESNRPCMGSGNAIQEQYPQKEDLVQAFVKASLTRRGIAAWVECPGIIHCGDRFEAVIPEPAAYPF